MRGEGGGADASRAEERLGRGEGRGSHWRGGGGANGRGTGEPTWAAGGVEGGGVAAGMGGGGCGRGWWVKRQHELLGKVAGWVGALHDADVAVPKHNGGGGGGSGRSSPALCDAHGLRSAGAAA